MFVDWTTSWTVIKMSVLPKLILWIDIPIKIPIVSVSVKIDKLVLKWYGNEKDEEEPGQSFNKNKVGILSAQSIE